MRSTFSRASDTSIDARRTVAMIVAAVVLVALTLLVYRRIFDYPMSTGDTWALLIGSRVAEWRDLIALFTTRLLDGTNFGGDFYRPVALLSYAIDQSLWGERSAGLYLTNVLVHGASAGLTSALAWRTTGNRAIALAAGLLMVLHPLAIEVVPSVARRQDLLAGLFALLTLAAVIRWSDLGRRRWLLAAAVAFAAGLASKEIAVFAPLVALAWLAIDERVPTGRERARRIVIVTVALGTALGLYLVARALVIEGYEGYGVRDHVWNLGGRISIYANQLFAPQGWTALFGGEPVSRGVTSVAIGAFVAITIRTAPDRRVTRLRAWLAFWAIGPMLVCVATGTFSYRSIYSGLPPVCLLLADVAIRGIAIREVAGAAPRGRASAAGVTALVALVFALPLVAFSPLFHAYPHWRASAEAFEDVFAQVDRALVDVRRADAATGLGRAAADGVEPLRRLELVGLPRFGRDFRPRLPSARSVSYYHRYVWNVRLQDSGHDVRVAKMHFEDRSGTSVRSRTPSIERTGDRLTIRFAPVSDDAAPVITSELTRR